MPAVKPEFEKYQKALERVNRQVNARYRKLLQMCWNTEPPNRGITSDILATAPFLTEKGWIYEIHCALDKLEDVNVRIERLDEGVPNSAVAVEDLCSRLFLNELRELSVDLA